MIWMVLQAALAQDVVPYSIDVERFKPAMDTYGYTVTESSTTLSHLQVGVGMWGNYSDDSLVLLDSDGNRIIGPPPVEPDGLLDVRAVTHFQAGLGLGNIFSLTVDLPVVVWQEGFEPSSGIIGQDSEEVLAGGLGDMRVNPKFVIFDIHKGYPVGLSVSAPMTVPMGEPRSFIGEGDFSALPTLAFEVANGSVRDGEYQFRGAINVGYRIKAKPDDFRGLILGNEFVYRAGIATRPAPAVELGADLQGFTSGTRLAQNPLEIFPFLRLSPAPIASFVIGAGFGLVNGVGAPDYRVHGGFTIAPKFDPLSLDRDKDGIPNKYDQCINIPEDLDGFEDEDGCPEDDNDEDGLKDDVDQCPDEPEDFDGFQDSDGCPELDNDQDRVLDAQDGCPDVPEDFDGWEDLDGCPEEDNDRDGYLDPVDRCPNAAETVNGFEDEDGCPDEKPFVDSDGDGYTDDVDQCPIDPEDFDGFEDEDGCPDLDNDNDGIPDLEDGCPFDPETVNEYQDDDGCPDEAPRKVVIKKTKIEILEKIFFEVNRAVIKSESFDLLNEIARVLDENPQLLKIRIEGHTDSDGSEAYNLKLSQSRASAVMTYLVEQGVQADRLEAVGFGESRPLDTNRTSEGKAANRRVEFVIVEQE